MTDYMRYQRLLFIKNDEKETHMKLEDLSEVMGLNIKLSNLKERLKSFSKLKDKKLYISSDKDPRETTTPAIPLSDNWIAMKVLAITHITDEITETEKRLRKLGVKV